MILYISLALVGSTYKPAQKSVQSEAQLHVTPSSLFEGDAKKLEPHLGIASGAVKIRYDGPPTELISHYEIWEKGKKTQTGGGPGIPITKTPYDGEFSVLIRKEGNEKQLYTMTMAFTDKTGYTQADTSLTPIDPKKSSGVSSLILKLHDPKSIAAGEEIAVLGIAMKEGNSIAVESIETAGQKADWILVIKLSTTNPKQR